MRTVVGRKSLLLLLTVSMIAVPAAQRGSPIVSFKSGPFKMNTLGGGGAVPSAGPVIKVLYDQTHRRYSQIDQKPLQLRATVTAACADMTLKELTLTTLGDTFHVNAPGLTNLAGVLTGATTLATNEVTTAKLSSVVPNPVATCNADMEAMVKQNQHGKVQKGWARMYDDALLAQLTAHCEEKPKKKRGFAEPPAIATPSASERFPVWIHCSPAPVFKADTSSPKVPAKKAGFQSVRVFVNPPANANYKGPCPKEMAFGGEVAYLMGPGAPPIQVRYRYRTHDGATSPVLTTTITKSGTTNVSYWKHQFGGSGGVGNLKAPGGSGARIIDGAVRLEVLGSDGQVIGQDATDVRLTCEPQRVAGAPAQADNPAPIATPQTMVMAGTPNPDARADLVITSAQPAGNSPTTLRIEVTNTGQGRSSGTTLAVFYHRSGHVVKKSFDVPPIAPGASRRILADLGSPLANAERLTARVNDSGQAQETNLSNNAFTIK